MMGHLRALSVDEELDGNKSNSIVRDTSKKRNNISLEQMLGEDIVRCEEFLNNPNDVEVGINLYVEITGKYDEIIPNFGYDLYQYIAENHFYDPDISQDTLIYNLKKLTAKMKSFQITNGDIITKKMIRNEKTSIVHNK